MESGNKISHIKSVDKSKKLCYAYIRVSTGKQVEEGSSLESQNFHINRYLDYKGYTLKNTYKDEGLSARTLNKRNELHKLLDIIEKDEFLVVFSLSRLVRNTKDALNVSELIKNKGAHLVSIKENIETDTAMGKFFFTIMAALAELESETTSERVKASISYMKDKNRFFGRIPYGYKLSGDKGSELIPDIYQQNIITLIIKLRDTPLLLGNSKNKLHTFSSIAVFLNNENIEPPDKSHVWYPETIKRIVNRYDAEPMINIKGRHSNDT